MTTPQTNSRRTTRSSTRSTKKSRSSSDKNNQNSSDNEGIPVSSRNLQNQHLSSLEDDNAFSVQSGSSVFSNNELESARKSLKDISSDSSSDSDDEIEEVVHKPKPKARPAKSQPQIPAAQQPVTPSGTEQVPAKRGRGRPRKYPLPGTQVAPVAAPSVPTPEPRQLSNQDTPAPPKPTQPQIQSSQKPKKTSHHKKKDHKKKKSKEDGSSNKQKKQRFQRRKLEQVLDGEMKQLEEEKLNFKARRMAERLNDIIGEHQLRIVALEQEYNEYLKMNPRLSTLEDLLKGAPQQITDEMLRKHFSFDDTCAKLQKKHEYENRLKAMKSKRTEDFESEMMDEEEEAEAEAKKRGDQWTLSIPNYFSASAGPAKKKRRLFCSMCGYPGNYHCKDCKSDVCSLYCLNSHLEHRCGKGTE